jgi:hypothetical protein
MFTAGRAVVMAHVPAAPSVWDPRLLWATVGLVAIVLAGVLLILWINSWRKRTGSKSLSANDQLAHFRELYERGELSHGEFDRIRATLAPQLRQELGILASGVPKAEAERPNGNDGVTR